MRLEPNVTDVERVPAEVAARFSESSRAPRAGATCRRRRPATGSWPTNCASVVPMSRTRSITRWRRSSRPSGRWRSRRCTNGTAPGRAAPARSSRRSARRSCRRASALLDDPARQARSRSLATLMCAHAALLAPALVQELRALRPRGRRVRRQGARVCRRRLRDGRGRPAGARRRTARPRGAPRARPHRHRARRVDRRAAAADRHRARAAPRPRKRSGTFRRRVPPRSSASCSATASSCCRTPRS